MYRNVKRRRTVYRSSDPPASTSKAELHLKMVLLSVWRDVQGIIHWEVLPTNLSTKPSMVPSTVYSRHPTDTGAPQLAKVIFRLIEFPIG
ncbi:hypothetical protein TNCV_1447531 [Trichonephila clavipes]|nr:hypothetical protein TNCV_1447531 [Trichonephila clavipes]